MLKRNSGKQSKTNKQSFTVKDIGNILNKKKITTHQITFIIAVE